MKYRKDRRNGENTDETGSAGIIMVNRVSKDKGEEDVL